MTKIISIILSFAIAMAALTSCGSVPDDDKGKAAAVTGGSEESRKESRTESMSDEDIKWDYRPMVYAYDRFYYDSDFVEELPEGTELIGSIEKQLDQTERPDENFVSNTDMAAQGSRVYAAEDRSAIYVEWTGSEKSGYITFVSEVEESPLPWEISEPKISYEETTENGVTLELKADSLTSAGADFIISNNSDKDVETGSEFIIEILKDGKWNRIDIGDSDWTLEAWIYKAGQSYDLSIDWKGYYGELPPSDYRLIKAYSFDGSPDKYYCICEFTIVNE